MVATKEKRKVMPEKHRVVADIIRSGKENATLLSDIMMIANIQDRRQAHLIIEELINEYGYVIGANRKGEHKGYYIPANEKEFEEIKGTFGNTIVSMYKRYSNLMRNYGQYSDIE